jgi:formylmethanofuran dehydrogenase subunit A
MSKLLIKNASVIATMDDDRTEIINKSIYCEDGKIVEIGDIENVYFNVIRALKMNHCLVGLQICTLYGITFYPRIYIYRP